MGMTIDECKELISVKQQLLDKLSEEPTMVISTAYAYAKNYVNYGEDVTKAWTTAVQNMSVIHHVKKVACEEAYNSFKKDYETRLKADMMAMLKELDLELHEQYDDTDLIKVKYVRQAIQQKIDALKGETQ